MLHISHFIFKEKNVLISFNETIYLSSLHTIFSIRCRTLNLAYSCFEICCKGNQLVVVIVLVPEYFLIKYKILKKLTVPHYSDFFLVFHRHFVSINAYQFYTMFNLYFEIILFVTRTALLYAYLMFHNNCISLKIKS